MKKFSTFNVITVQTLILTLKCHHPPFPLSIHSILNFLFLLSVILSIEFKTTHRPKFTKELVIGAHATNKRRFPRFFFKNRFIIFLYFIYSQTALFLTSGSKK